MKWETQRLSEVAELCLGKMLDQKKNKGELRPYLANLNVRWGRFDLDNLREMPFQNHELERYGLRYGDIVMCEGGSEPGRCAIWQEQAPGTMLQKALHRIRPHPTVDAHYLYYALRHLGRNGNLDGFFTGAAIQHLTGEQLAKVEIRLPPLETQGRIASILKAYDELIEVNRRRVAVLEDMARGLFEEWFVRFRFPGHQSVSIFKTPRGPLPQGWCGTTVSSAFSLSRGRSYRSIDLADTGGKPFVNLKCILRDGGFKTAGIKRYTGEYKVGHVVSQGDMVMAVTDMTQDRRIVGRVGRVPLLDEPEAVISMDLVKVLPAPNVDRTFLYCWLRYSGFGLQAAQHANGANVLHLSPKAVVDLPICLPPFELQTKFGESTEPLLHLAEVLALSDQRLNACRDLLLPRLISGQLSVSAAERQLEEAA